MPQETIWSQAFPITSVTRADLVSAGIPRKIVKHITDEQMKHIASKMEDYYCDDTYWEHVRLATKYVIEHDIQSAEGTGDDNPYCVSLTPEEFHELLEAYETFVRWCQEDMTAKQWALAQQVLNRLSEADASHGYLDDGAAGGG